MSSSGLRGPGVTGTGLLLGPRSEPTADIQVGQGAAGTQCGALLVSYRVTLGRDHCPFQPEETTHSVAQLPRAVPELRPRGQKKAVEKGSQPRHPAEDFYLFCQTPPRPHSPCWRTWDCPCHSSPAGWRPVRRGPRSSCSAKPGGEEPAQDWGGPLHLCHPKPLCRTILCPHQGSGSESEFPIVISRFCSNGILPFKSRSPEGSKLDFNSLKKRLDSQNNEAVTVCEPLITVPQGGCCSEPVSAQR